jgi:hypothetical protein
MRDQDNVKQAICMSCIARANETRKENGMEPLVVHPDAYEPFDENELGG